MFKYIIFFICNGLLLSFNTQGQKNNIPIGEWRVHLPYSSTYCIEIAKSKIFASAQINGFFYDRNDNSLEDISTTNYLNDIKISKARYHAPLDMLVIGYENGNIDIIKDNYTININDIKRRNITGSKKINNISFNNNVAYLACDFGVVVFDLQRLEVKETYSNLAPSGLTNRVFGTTFSSDNDSIFLATQRGVMAARLSSVVNLMDFSNWRTYGLADNIPATEIKDIVNLNGRIYAGINNLGFYFFNGISWSGSAIPSNPQIHFMRVSQGKLLIAQSSDLLIVVNESNITTTTDGFFTSVNDGMLDSGGKLWFASSIFGVLTNDQGSYRSILPNGPYRTNAFNLSYYENKIVVAAGAYSNFYGNMNYPGEYYIFNNGTWELYSQFTPGFPNALDITKSYYNKNDKTLYLPTHGLGLLLHKNDGTFDIWNDTNAPFVRSLPGPGPYVLITDVKADRNGTLWITNSHVPTASSPSLHYKKTNGTWTSHSFNIEAARFPVEILIDNNDYKWIRLRHDGEGGIIVYNEKTNFYKHLTQNTNAGGLPDKAVRCMAMDKNGDIWVGTQAGIGVFYNTSSVLTSTSVNATKPLFDGFPLLFNEIVTAIEIDGGNRKWIGTLNGVWLLNDDGTEVIHYFNVNNSPLFSNNIVDIEINDITGEVFIATDQGLISYRGNSTEAKEDHSNVKIFPNPVKADFNGWIGISGLVKDATVKITDIFGNMIYETKAEGGTAVWNGKDYNGRRASTGVYLIFSSDENGEESFAGKIAVE